MKKFNITVNGTAYEVEVEEVKAAAPKAPKAPAAPAPAPEPEETDPGQQTNEDYLEEETPSN